MYSSILSGRLAHASYLLDRRRGIVVDPQGRDITSMSTKAGLAIRASSETHLMRLPFRASRTGSGPLQLYLAGRRRDISAFAVDDLRAKDRQIAG